MFHRFLPRELAMPGMFAEKRALVTGGSSGIGWAIALALAEADCHVTVTGVDLPEPRALEATDKAILARELDVSDSAAVKKTLERFDRLDILVNCAGIILRDGAEHDPDAFERVIDVNLNGTMRMCAACKPLLSERGGCVLNMASMLSFFGSGHVPAYSASKGGIAQLTKSLAIAWAPEGIRVNALAPGWIRTALTRPLVEDEARNAAIVDRTPLGRWGRPEDLIGPALFLCSPASAFVTGVIMPVDGGYSIA
jgi:NAD(P)-dependent dehydrogenase (short-subunit alcohol dehydrogenase family)